MDTFHSLLRTAAAFVIWATAAAGVAAVEPKTAPGKNPVDLNLVLASVPEYAPTAAVVVSEDFITDGYDSAGLVKGVVAAGAKVIILTAQSRAPDFLRSTLAALHLTKAEFAAVSFRVVPHSHVWLRDYGPFPVFSTKNGAKALLNFVDFKYGSGPDDEHVPQVLGDLLQIPVLPVPVLLDGGNILVAGDTCLTSSIETPPGTKGLAAELIEGPFLLKDRFAQAAGCKNVLIIKDPPHEHIDMWLKVVGPKTLLINELEDRSLAAYKSTYGAVPQEWLRLKDRLDQRATELATQFTVKRLPMPLPYRGVFRTYVNSILVNAVAIVPKYSRYGWNYDDYPDRSLEGFYESKVAAIYKELGYDARFVNADGLIFNGGAFHCVAIQIPQQK